MGAYDIAKLMFDWNHCSSTINNAHGQHAKQVLLGEYVADGRVAQITQSLLYNVMPGKLLQRYVRLSSPGNPPSLEIM